MSDGFVIEEYDVYEKAACGYARASYPPPIGQ